MSTRTHRITQTLGLLAALLVLAPAARSASQVQDYNAILRSLAPIAGQPEGTGTIDLDIQFELGSARLSVQADRQLAELGRALTTERLTEARIGIYGHTDALGSRAFNQGLSERRAAAVSDYLIQHFAIARTRLVVQGFGETRLKNPLAPHAAENRRVEIVNLGPMVAQPQQNDALDESGRIRW